ncbi:MAG: YkgJ family cysteine cluster protein [Thermoguttaceae bacterium]
MSSCKPKRDQLGPEEVLCSFCAAKCCRYFALPIDKPDDWRQFDFMRWFLLHQHASVFVDNNDWYLLVHTPCKHLSTDNLCGIYETRPQICREYTTAKCEYEDLWVYDQYFECPEQVEEYAQALLGPRPGLSLRSPKC